jgi:hypothetical protein
LNDLIRLFIDNILPVFIVAGLGYLAAQRFKASPRVLSQLTFNIFSPCLLFVLLTQNPLAGQVVLKMILFVAVLITVSGLLAYFVGRALRLERNMLAGLMLVSMFMNAGNFGLPVTQFAFGDEALAYASLFFVAMAIFTYSIGTVIASMGSTSLKDSLLNLLKIPTIYAIPIALLFGQFNWHLPVSLSRPVELLADATIPSMLIVLGMQLQTARWSGGVRALSAALVIRMVAMPVVAFFISPFFGWQGVAYQAVMLESAMPAAVITTMLATEFGTAPSFVAFTVFAGTLLSPLVLTPIMAWVQGS